MAKKPTSKSKKAGSKPKRAPKALQEIANSFFWGRVLDYRSAFNEVYSRGGLQFVRDKVKPQDQKLFATTFDKLVELGCLPSMLARTIFNYCQLQKLTSEFSFPSINVIRKYKQTLVEAVDIIGKLDDYSVIEVMARHAGIGKLAEKRFADREFPDERDYGPCLPSGVPIDPDQYRDSPEQERELERDYTPDRLKLIDGLEWHIRALPQWQAPRKDIVWSYAPTACILYSEIATDNFQFPLVAQLLECLGYEPNPERQKQTEDQPRGEEADSFADSIRRNFNNFNYKYPIVCKSLRAHLVDGHDFYEERLKEKVDRWIEGGVSAETVSRFATFLRYRMPHGWWQVFGRPYGEIFTHLQK